MTLKLYNTLTREIEDFEPIETGKVNLYTCGPTVHDYVHIGNFRAFLFYDLLRRVLQFSGYKVKQIMNITDVDDKTIKKAQKAGKSLKDYTLFYEKAFLEDQEKLRIHPADKYPRATEHIPEMVAMIKTLLEKGIAYKSDDNCIYFAVRKFKDYGKFARVNLEELKGGASGRMLSDEYDKDQVQDFALWKAWTPEDGDIFWETELGKGRPGWHIECSAMSMKYLGESFDIHAGGEDLIFPHHQNEIAQSEGATGKQFAKYWVHNSWLLVEGKKMSKSLGNFYTLRDILEKGYDPVVVRYYLMSVHYRQQFNLTFEALDGAKAALQRLWDCYDNLALANAKENTPEVKERSIKFIRAFTDSIENDLEISQALAAMFDFVKDCNVWLAENKLSHDDGKAMQKALEHVDAVLGVLKKEKGTLTKEEEELISKREEARKAKDWKRSDELRDELKKKGIIIEDSLQGPKWKKA